MKIKFLIGFIIGIIIISVGIYFLVIPPRVISFNPSNQDQDVGLNSPLIIKFDKPLKRQKLQHDILPKAYGEWRFEDPLIKNHLFRTLEFKPAVDFEPDTQYQVKLEQITNPLGIGFSGTFSFTFKTQTTSEVFQEKIEEEAAPPQKETSLPEKTGPQITLLDIPLDWQDYPLSCEAASLKMALISKGVYVSEQEIMEKIGYDTTPHQGNIWGDPYQAYVGDINGKICRTGYGVYWEPLAKAANNWREAEFFSGWSLGELIREIEAGDPVIVWGVLPTGKLTNCSWYTPEGKYIKAFRETHVRLVVGFIGDANNPSKIILNDPLAGRLYWATPYFLTNWKTFGYSGVVIR